MQRAQLGPNVPSHIPMLPKHNYLTIRIPYRAMSIQTHLLGPKDKALKQGLWSLGPAECEFLRSHLWKQLLFTTEPILIVKLTTLAP